MQPHPAPPTIQLDTGPRYIIRISGHRQTIDLNEWTPQSDIPRHRYFTVACPHVLPPDGGFTMPVTFGGRGGVRQRQEREKEFYREEKGLNVFNGNST